MAQRLLVAALLASLLGCGEKVRVYTVPKAPTNTPAARPASEFRPDAFKWETPEGWVDQGASGQRLASYEIPGADGPADGSLVVLSGEAGGPLGNVNRWRSQMGLEAMNEEQLLEQIQPVRIAGYPGFVIAMRGAYRGMGDTPKPGYFLIAGMAGTPFGTVFVKLVGPDPTVSAEVETFIHFLGSIRVPEAAGTHSPAAGAAPTAGSASGFHWQTPAGWHELAPSSGRLASFDAHGSDGGHADISLYKLLGDGGGIEQNINRWRGQLQLPPLEPDALQATLLELQVAGRSAVGVELHGSYAGMGGGAPQAGFTMLGVIALSDSDALFAKMVGPAATVAEHKQAFFQLVESLTQE